MLLSVEDLEMRFGDKVIQSEVSFSVERGMIFAIMGVSGCGKSTLLKHMVGLLRPARGRIAYDGVDYWASDDATRTRLRAGFGMLFQSAALWSSMTLLENVCMPLEQHTQLDAAQRDKRAHEVLGWVDLDEYAHYFPSDLSGGMKKRAGLARAIVTEPPLLLLDEPSAGLAPVVVQQVFELVKRIRAGGLTVLIVEQNVQQVLRVVDRAYLLEAGTIRASGSSSEMLADDSIRQAYLGI